MLCYFDIARPGLLVVRMCSTINPENAKLLAKYSSEQELHKMR